VKMIWTRLKCARTNSKIDLSPHDHLLRRLAASINFSSQLRETIHLSLLVTLQFLRIDSGICFPTVMKKFIPLVWKVYVVSCRFRPRLGT
jgi:hypothetical protein